MTSSETHTLYYRLKVRYLSSNSLAKIDTSTMITYYGKWEYIDASYLWQAEYYFCTYLNKLLYAYNPRICTMYIIYPYEGMSVSSANWLKTCAKAINAFTAYLNSHDMHVIKYIRLEKGGENT